MKDNKTTFVTILFITFMIIFSIALFNVKADSGWDTSYDSSSSLVLLRKIEIEITILLLKVKYLDLLL